MKITRGKYIIISLISIILLILLDQLTKFYAIQVLKGTGGIDIISGIFKLQYLENRGAAFGMMQNQFIFFYIMTPCILIVISYILCRLPMRKRFLPIYSCTILLISGALGNYIDRIRLKFVVDFLYFELINFPIFNIADIYVCVAVGLYILLLLFYYSEDELEEIKLFKK